MDIIKRFTFADDAVMVTVISAKDLVNKAIALHDLSPTAAAALGRTLIAGAFMSFNLKGRGESLSVTVSGGGGLGKIIVAAEAGAKVRGYVENPRFERPVKNGKLDVGGAVGKEGFITVIKDLGLKEPYTGRTALIDGEIASDFAYYFTLSEQQPSAVALGVLADKEGCAAAGGIFVQPLPFCPDHVLTVAEDIVSNFTNVSLLFNQMTADQIIERYFGHLGLNFLEEGAPEYKCRCGAEKMERIIVSLGKDEAESILDDQGKIEICCQFCGSKYSFRKSEVEKLFGR